MESAGELAKKCYDCTWDTTERWLGGTARVSMPSTYALPRIAELIEADRKAIREEYAGLVERHRSLMNPILDAYCRYFLADDDSQAEELARNQLEIEIATAAIDLRGEGFLKDFEVIESRAKAALEGKVSQ
jgi:hypothetical protein